MMADGHAAQNFLRILVPGHDPNVDVIAVHGLNPKNKENHAERTWELNGKLWLRDFLPKKLPRARILLYGYNSSVGIQSSAAGVREQAHSLLNRLWLERKGCGNRPILFIAHSLGGIVVKEALVQAKIGTLYHPICTATFGIVFFGTPHRGSSLTDVGEIFAKIVRAVLRSPSNTFLRALKKGDLYANELSSNFQQLQEDYRYLNFYETLPLKSFGLIVEKDSAVLGLPDTREKAIALNANHEAICRFASEEDEDYKWVSEMIVEFVKSAVEPQRKSSVVESFDSLDSSLVDDGPEPTFLVPYSRNQRFVDRKPIFEQLKSRILPIGKLHSRVAVFGLGGIGKSQIAIEFAYQIYDEYKHVSVFWVHASSSDRFREAYSQIADECNIPGRNDEKCDKISLVKNWLEKEHKDWLMIIDNADASSLFTSNRELSQLKSKTRPYEAPSSLLGYLPETPHGSILITTRNRAAGVKFTRSCSSDLIEVKPMTDEESRHFIKATLTNPLPSDTEIHELATLLGHLPLALAQAFAFILENVVPVSEYIELYNEGDETQMELLSEPFEALGRDSGVPNAVTATLILSINEIKAHDPKAVEILCLVAFVDQHDIPKSLMQGKIKRPLELTKALGMLKAYSLVTATERGNFSLHRLVQLVMRKWMKLEEKFNEQAVQAMDVTAELFPNATFEQWPVCALYLPHAQSVLKFVPQLHGKLLRRKLYLQEGIAYYLWTQGYSHEAEKLDLIIVEENKKQFGMEHPETLESLEGLASTYESQGKWSEAEKLDRYLVETRERLLGPTHDLTLNNKANLAKTFGEQCLFAEAEALTLEVLEVRKTLLGKEHASTLNTMRSLGYIYSEIGQTDKAEELVTYVWRCRKEVSGADHESTLEAAATLGYVYIQQGRLQDAEALLLETIQAQGRHLGPSHPRTLMAKVSLGRVYQETEEWSKAEDLALDVMAEHANRVGRGHYDTLVAKQDLVNILYYKGEIGLSDTLEDEVLKDSIRNLGRDHLFTLHCMREVAFSRRRQNRDQEAIKLMVQVVSRRERVLGPFHDDTLMPFGTLCEWCGNDEAIELLFEAEKEQQQELALVQASTKAIV